MKKRTVLIVLIILASVLIVFVAKNHPFVDGNKRTAFLALGLFLAMNEWRLETTQIDAIETMLSLARGTLDEHALAVWIREKIVRIK
jgi:death-on-curing protein